MLLIDPKDISVIIQGAIDERLTKKCIQSVRKYLPGAKIILSTWKGAITKNLDFDVLIENSDPGSLGWHFYGDRIVPFNYNRQLISTREGLKKSDRKYSLKIRSDFYLNGKHFLDYFEKFQKRRDEYSLFKHRVIVTSVYTRMFFSGSAFPTPFTVSDFFFFGLTEDLNDYFETKCISEEDACNWKFILPERKPDRLETGRYAPEQFLCYNWIKRHGLKCIFKDCSDWNWKNLAVSNAVLFNNFIVLNSRDIGLKSKKHFLPNLELMFGIVTSKIFFNEYEKIFIDNADLFSMERYIKYWKFKKKTILSLAKNIILKIL